MKDKKMETSLRYIDNGIIRMQEEIDELKKCTSTQQKTIIADKKLIAKLKSSNEQLSEYIERIQRRKGDK